VNAAIEPARLYTVLDRTNIRAKDPVMYQLLYNLIGNLANLVPALKEVSDVVSTGAGVGPASVQTITYLIELGDGGGSGDDGPPGPQGLRGADGVSNIPGPQGPIGWPGEDGIDGELFAIPGGQGPTGNAGATGPMGAIGWPGEDGVDADLFPIPGPIGPVGNTGATGPAGSSGSGLPPVRNEIPSGSINGSNTVFTTAAAYTQLAVYLNGLRLKKTTHYSETTSTTFTLVDAPIVGDVVMVDYGGEGGATSVTAGNGLVATGVVLDVVAGDGLTAAPDILDLKLDGATLVKSASGLKVAPSPAIGVSVYRTTNLTVSVVPGDPSGTLSWEAAKFNPDSSWSSSVNPSRLTCASTGKYIITAQISNQSLTGTGFAQLWIYKNGVIQLANSQYTAPCPANQCVVEEELITGDYIELVYKITEFGGSTRPILAGAGITFMQMLMIPPSTIATGGGGTVGAGSVVLLEIHTVSGASTIDFTTRNAPGQSGATFQNDYDDYIFEFVNVRINTSGGIGLQVSTNGGSTYDTVANNYVTIYQYSTSATGSGASGNLGNSITSLNMTTSTDIGMSGSFHLFDPTNSGFKKCFDGHMTYQSGVAGTPYVQSSVSVVWFTSTAAINAINFYSVGGGTLTGTVRMYGMAKS